MFTFFVGARPNFMKIAPLCKEFSLRDIPYEVYHSGQHDSYLMSDIFINNFNIKNVTYMNCFSSNHVKMVQNVLRESFSILKNGAKNIIIVGDVSTSYAVSLAAARIKNSSSDNVTIIHVEAGLRSFDISMPEEHNRITIDHVSDYLFAPSYCAVENLVNEGIEPHRIHMVGNIMIDTLTNMLPFIKENAYIKNRDYAVVTFHRPENVDNFSVSCKIVEELRSVSNNYDVFFFIHPRTKQKFEEFGIFNRLTSNGNIKVADPVDYVTFMEYVYNASCVITDSGGIQEETTYLNIPCFTVRKNTERPITINQGSNKLIKYDMIANSILNIDKNNSFKIPEKWDGMTAKRIVNVLTKGVK